MDKKKELKIISLGGVGGCAIRGKIATIDKIKNNRVYIYDWIVATQDFIINSFYDYSKYIKFDNNDMNIRHPYHYNDEDGYIDAVAIHHKFNIKNNSVFFKRYNNLQETMKNNKIILIRDIIIDKNNCAIFHSKNPNNIGFFSDTLKSTSLDILNKYELKTIFKSYKDDIEKWRKFHNNITNYYKNKDIILILFSYDVPFYDYMKNIDKNIFLVKAYNWKLVNKIIGYDLININTPLEKMDVDMKRNGSINIP